MVIPLPRFVLMALTRHAAIEQGLPWPLLAALIAVESGFNPRAYRAEPQIEDSSYGLMQILGKTARGFGYRGALGDVTTRTGGLFDPSTNVHYGAQFLAAVLRQAGGDELAGASAYNGGFRPALAFGSRATVPVTVCLAWKDTAPARGRTLAHDCATPFTAKVGEFGNQPYVDRVARHMRAFAIEAKADGIAQ